MCTVRLFSQGIDLFHSNFTSTGSSPSTNLSIRKLDTGLPDGEDRIPLRSLVLTQYILECDGGTDGQAGGRIYRSACKAGFVCSVL